MELVFVKMHSGKALETPVMAFLILIPLLNLRKIY